MRSIFRGFCINRFGIGPLHYISSRGVVFQFEYLRELEVKIGTARKVVQRIYEDPIYAKTPENPPHCHVPPFNNGLTIWTMQFQVLQYIINKPEGDFYI